MQGIRSGRWPGQRRRLLGASALLIVAWVDVVFGLSAAFTTLITELLASDRSVRSGSVSWAPSSFRSGRGRMSRLERHAAREAHIAVVDVNVTLGKEDAFLTASLANARESVKEASNLRFDILQSREVPGSFALVEIYRDEAGPLQHKEESHYLAWRETVADMMASPRSASQWDTVFPKSSSGYKPSAVILERDFPAYMEIFHVFVDVLPGKEQAFIEVTLPYAKESIKEEGNLRFDVMQSPDEPTKFLLVEVYRSQEGAELHPRRKHYVTWRNALATMKAAPVVSKRYTNHFPNLPAGWKVDPDVQ